MSADNQLVVFEMKDTYEAVMRFMSEDDPYRPPAPKERRWFILQKGLGAALAFDIAAIVTRHEYFEYGFILKKLK